MADITLVQAIAIAISATLWLWLGIMAFRKPSELLVRFGLKAVHRDARNEVRAVYGGFPLAMAAILPLSLADREIMPGVVITIAAATFGMAIGRLVSAALDGGMGRLPLAFLVIELALSAVLVMPTTMSL